MKSVVTVTSMCLLVSASLLLADSPDLSQLDAEGLRTLAGNLYNKLAQVQRERDALAGQAKQLQSDLAAAQAQLATVSKALADLRTAVSASPELQERLSAHEAIEKAIAEKRLVKGMTLDQANQAMGKPGRKVYEDETGAVEYVWERYQTYQTSAGGTINARYTGVRSVTRKVGETRATFVNGKLETFVRQ